MVRLGVPGWGDGFGGAGIGQWGGRGGGVSGLGPLTAELLLEEFEELRPAQGVHEELAEVEAPALHAQLRGGRHPAGDTGVGAGSEQPWPPARPRRARGWRSLRGRLRGGVHGPVGGVVRDPGVAGQAAGHDGVVRHVLLVELDVPARSSGWRWPGPPAHRCHRRQPPRGRGRVTAGGGMCLGSAMTTGFSSAPRRG